MSDRLTVVFDDPDLYRRVKVRAAEEGVPMKALVERALRQLLGDETDNLWTDTPKAMDWEAFDKWQAEVERLYAESPDDYPRDLSDVKKHLYGPDRRPGGVKMVAEERAEYDAR